MKFNPISNELFSNDGHLIKKLHCPFKVEWDNLEVGSDKASRCCEICKKVIIDTVKLTDSEILSIVKDDPNTCLKLNFNQENLEIIFKDVLEKK